MVADFFYLAFKGKKIFESIGFLVGVAKKCGRMERAHKKYAALFDKLTVLFRDPEILVDKSLRRNSAEADDNFRTD